MMFQFVAVAQNSFQTNEANNLFIDNQVTICFGEKLPEQVFSNMGTENLQIQIVDAENKSFFYSPNQEYQFATPGEFEVVLKSDSLTHGDGECHHEDHTKRFKLLVLPYRIEFILDDVAFSTEIKGGMEMKGHTLSVPVMFYSFTNEAKYFSGLQVISSGVNTTIKGKTEPNTFLLQPGLNKVTYSLDGLASKGTYIMFDFIDSLNRIISYAYPNILK